MKSILLIVASLFAVNENMNISATTYSMFGHVQAIYEKTANDQGGKYTFTYIHTPSEMSSYVFNSFKNGSSDLYFNISPLLNVDIEWDWSFKIRVGNSIYPFELETEISDGNYYKVQNFFENFVYNDTTEIVIEIPTLDNTPLSNFESILDNTRFYTFLAFVEDIYYQSGYTDGTADGYLEGYTDGYDPNAYTDGFEEGYTDGYQDGVYSASLGELPDLFTILGSAFTSIASILSITLFPGFTLGLLLFLPLIFGIAYVLLKLLLGNG